MARLKVTAYVEVDEDSLDDEGYLTEGAFNFLTRMLTGFTDIKTGKVEEQD